MIDWSPDKDDEAFEAGYNFVEDNRDRGDGYHSSAPWWYGWMVRTAFWAGVKWERDRIGKRQEEASKFNDESIRQFIEAHQ